MLEQDYLIGRILLLLQAIRRVANRHGEQQSPQDCAESLESAIGQATDLDGSVLLALAPRSMATVLEASGVEPQLVMHIAKTLQLEAYYLRQAGNGGLANIRDNQAQALAANLGEELAPPLTGGELDAFLEEIDREWSSLEN